MNDRAVLLLVVVCTASAATAAEVKPSRPFADAYRAGQDQFYLGKYKDAMASFQHARDLEPKLPGPHRWLGRTARALQRWEDCVASSTEALRLRPDSPLFSQVKDDIDTCRAALRRPTYGKRLTPGQG